MSEIDFWQRLQEDWQSAPSAVDLSALRRQVHRKRRRMQLLQALDVVLGLVATGVMIKQLYFLHVPHVRLLFWILVFFVWASVALGVWLRRSTWKPRGTDARSLLQLTIRRARAGLRFVWANLAGLLLLYAVAAPFFVPAFLDGTLRRRYALAGVVYAQVAVFALGVAWALWYGRRQKHKLRQAKALLEQLDMDAEDAP